MQLTTEIPQMNLTRQERLVIWMRRNGLNQAALARFAGVEPNATGRWVRADRLPTWRVNQMREFGIPEELLPRAEDISTGPRKGQCSRSASNIAAQTV